MQQLSGQDASFVYMETPTTPMHIGSFDALLAAAKSVSSPAPVKASPKPKPKIVATPRKAKETA